MTSPRASAAASIPSRSCRSAHITTRGCTAATTTCPAPSRCCRSAAGWPSCSRPVGGRRARSSSAPGTARSTACSDRPSTPRTAGKSRLGQVVSYFNMDIAAGQDFGASSVPSLDGVDPRRCAAGALAAYLGHGLRRLGEEHRLQAADAGAAGQRIGLHRVPGSLRRARGRHRVEHCQRRLPLQLRQLLHGESLHRSGLALSRRDRASSRAWQYCAWPMPTWCRCTTRLMRRGEYVSRRVRRAPAHEVRPSEGGRAPRQGTGRGMGCDGSALDNTINNKLAAGQTTDSTR